jgi:hypothetical protein
LNLTARLVFIGVGHHLVWQRFDRLRSRLAVIGLVRPHFYAHIGGSSIGEGFDDRDDDTQIEHKNFEHFFFLLINSLLHCTICDHKDGYRTFESSKSKV